MTIAAGFVCLDGVVLCADTQETISGYTKTNTEKIRIWGDQGLGIAITGAGNAESIETVGKLIQEALTWQYQPNILRFPKEVRQIIQDTFLRFFLKHITPYAEFPAHERPEVELLIAVSVANEVNTYDCLFKASGTTVREIEMGADCIGTGVILAKSLIEKLYSPGMGLDELVIAACYILGEAKRWVDGCGGNTDLLVASFKHNTFVSLPSAEIRVLEDHFEELNRPISEIIIGFPNPNLSTKEFERAANKSQKWMGGKRDQMFSKGSRFFELLERLKTKPPRSKSDPH